MNDNIIYKSTRDEFENGFNNASVVNNDKNYGYNFKYQKFCQNKVLSNYQDLTIILWINFYLKISKMILRDSNSTNISFLPFFDNQ